MKKAITILLLAIIAFSCNPTKRLERKEEKAWDVFYTSPRLLDRATPLVLAIHPCISEIVRSDTSFLYVTDTVTVTKKIPYTVHKTIDTLIDNISVYADSTGIYVKYLGITKTITKTIRDTVIDKSALDRAIDSLNNYKVKEGAYLGQITQLGKQLDSETKERNKWMYWFWGLLAAVVSVNIILLYVKFKTKIPLIP